MRYPYRSPAAPPGGWHQPDVPDYPIPPPIMKAEASDPQQLESFLEAYEKRSQRRRAYYLKNRERLLAYGRKYAAKKRAERAKYWCLLNHTQPLTRAQPAKGYVPKPPTPIEDDPKIYPRNY